MQQTCQTREVPRTIDTLCKFQRITKRMLLQEMILLFGAKRLCNIYCRFNKIIMNVQDPGL